MIPAMFIYLTKPVPLPTSYWSVTTKSKPGLLHSYEISNCNCRTVPIVRKFIACTHDLCQLAHWYGSRFSQVY